MLLILQLSDPFSVKRSTSIIFPFGLSIRVIVLLQAFLSKLRLLGKLPVFSVLSISRNTRVCKSAAIFCNISHPPVEISSGAPLSSYGLHDKLILSPKLDQAVTIFMSYIVLPIHSYDLFCNFIW